MSLEQRLYHTFKERGLFPFKIIPVGIDKFKVYENSSLLSGFNYEGHIRISGLGETFPLKANQKIYLEIYVQPNLEPSSITGVVNGVTGVYGAFIRHSYVGIGDAYAPNYSTLDPLWFSKTNDEDYYFDGKPYWRWSGYPEAVEVLPLDVTGVGGKIIQKTRNKRQTKAFVLIGYTTTGTEDGFVLGYGDGYVSGHRFKVVQTLDNNLTMMHFCRNGIPVTYPFPHSYSPFIKPNIT